jgi:exodeoxyribonuclease-5
MFIMSLHLRLIEKFMQLTQDQQHAVEQAHRFIRSDEQAFGIYGAAGTGKSTVIQRVVDYLLKQKQEVYLCAPTHKAVSVLSEKAQEAGLSVCTETVHSMLNMICCQDDDKGEEYFAPNKGFDAPISNADWIIIDECSMLDSFIWSKVLEESHLNKVRLFVMGDKFQLPPVQESTSPAFEVNGVELLEVVRHTGYLASQVIQIREHINDRNPPLAANGTDPYGEVLNMTKPQWRDRFLDDLRAGKDVIALAWRNKTVNAINDYIRGKLHGEDAPPFLPGEPIVFNSPYEHPELERMYRNSERLEILTAEWTQYKSTPCWRLQLSGDCDESEDDSYVYALAPDQEAYYREQCDRRHKMYRESVRHGRQAAKNAAKLYWEYKKAFAFVRVDYATTVHKSQGSTYDAVYVHQTDILGAKRDRSRLLYVAYSRARNGLYLI